MYPVRWQLAMRRSASLGSSDNPPPHPFPEMAWWRCGEAGSHAWAPSQFTWLEPSSAIGMAITMA
eukprot:7443529-Pyramimonas_sp.AAC.1